MTSPDVIAIPGVASQNGRASEFGRRVVAEPALGIKLRPIEFLFEGRVPRGMLTTVVGRQGDGKTQLVCKLMADGSRGKLRGALHSQPFTSALVSGEDDWEAVLAPRLLAAGADLKQILRVDVREGDNADLLTLPDDAIELVAAIREHGAELLVIDPITAFLDPEINAHRDTDVRRALSYLGAAAAETGLTVIVVMHPNKGASTDALIRTSGAGAFTQAPRSVLLFGADPNDADGPGRVLAHSKCNVGRKQPSLAYRVETARVEGDDGVFVETAHLVADGESSATDRDILAAAGRDGEERSERDEAKEFLAGTLSVGPEKSKVLFRLADEAGISRTTLRRAKRDMGVEAVQLSNGWHWELAGEHDE